MRIQRFLATLILCSVCLLLLHALLLHAERREFPIPYGSEVSTWADAYGVPASVVYAVIKVESDFRVNAVSEAGAKGLMQITDDTFEWIRSRIGSMDDHVFAPSANIQYGTYYLSYLYGRFGDWEVALAAYNAGPNRVSGWIKEQGPSFTIPYRETREYVVRVQAAVRKYEKLYYQGDIKS